MPFIWYSQINLLLLQRKYGTGSPWLPLFLLIKERYIIPNGLIIIMIYTPIRRRFFVPNRLGHREQV